MDNAAGGIFFILLAAGAYLLPWIVAATRNTVNRGGVAVVNVFLGWTIIGWVVALAMAAGGQRQDALGTLSTGTITATRQAPQGADIRQCPYCAEDIKRAAVVCKHCGRDVPPADEQTAHTRTANPLLSQVSSPDSEERDRAIFKIGGLAMRREIDMELAQSALPMLEDLQGSDPSHVVRSRAKWALDYVHKFLAGP